MEKQYTAVIDIDTLIIHAALAGQETSVLVTHRKTGWTRSFKNKTEFYGHHTKKEGGWLGKINADKLEKGLPQVSTEDFEILPITKKLDDQQTDSGLITAEAIVKGRLRAKIDAIANKDWCKDFKICFGTGKNFRYDIAQTQPYKQDRPTKPLLYEVVRDYMLSKYQDKLIVYDGVETDEIVIQEVHKAWIRCEGDFDKLDTVAVFVDKDLSQEPCLWYNFDNPDAGLVRITEIEACKNFACQHLTGDKIDSIPGLPSLVDDLYSKYQIRRTKGLGKATARALLESAQSPSEVFERVVEAYRAFYGGDYKEFTTFRGDVLSWNWLDHLNERFRLLKMRTDVTEDVGHVKEYLDKLGVML